MSTPAQAVGVVAILVPEVFVPLTAAENAAAVKIAEQLGWQIARDAPAALEVEERDEGFIVRAPAYAQCGCRHPLFRVAYRVTRDGSVCPAAEQPVLLAVSGIALCVD